MKKIFTLSFFILAFILNAQKKKNGNLYIEHPYIDVVEKFNTAFTSGDTETLKSLVSDDFKWYTTNARTPRTIDQLIGRSSYLSKNVTNFQIKHWGGSYPDVLEYKKDKVTDVKTYERLTGYDKNTGVDLRMPRYATFRFDNESKITRMWVNDDQLLWKKAYDAYDTRKNGIIYKDHPFISNIRLMISGMKEMDIDKIRSYYDENARIYDVMNSGEFEFLTLDEEMTNIENAIKAYEIVYIQEIGYPDALAYEGGNVVVISWWKMRIKNRKSGKTGTIMQHIQHTLNKEGKIIREDYYYNPAQFPK
tara:strand:+ start:42 stop:959 length:918 start_codon:yes stop_codon:yes gene_type:complete